MGLDFAERVNTLYDQVSSHLTMCDECSAAADMHAVALCPTCGFQLEGIREFYLKISECEDVDRATRVLDFVSGHRIDHGDKIRVIPQVYPALGSAQKTFLRQFFGSRRLYLAGVETTTSALDVLRAIVVRDQMIATHEHIAQAHFDCKKTYNVVADYGFVAFPQSTIKMRDLVNRMVADSLQSMRVVLPASDCSDLPFDFPVPAVELCDHADFEYEGLHYAYRISRESDLFRVGYLMPVPKRIGQLSDECHDIQKVVPLIYSDRVLAKDYPEGVKTMSEIIDALAEVGMTFEDLKEEILTDDGIRAIIIDKPVYLDLLVPDVVALKVGFTMENPPAPVRYFVDPDEVLVDPYGFVTSPAVVAVGIRSSPIETALPPDETQCYLSLLKEGIEPELEGGRFPDLLDDKVIAWMDSRVKSDFLPVVCVNLTTVDDGLAVHVQPRGHYCSGDCHATVPGYQFYILMRYAFCLRMTGAALAASYETLPGTVTVLDKNPVTRKGSDGSVDTATCGGIGGECLISFGALD